MGGSTVYGSPGCYNTIVGGRNNKMSGPFGQSNFGEDIVIAGSNITADRSCTTFVNNLSIKNIPTSDTNLPSGSIWRESSTNYLKIVP